MHNHNNGLKTAALFGGIFAVLLAMGWAIAGYTGNSTFIWVFALIGVGTTFYSYWNSDKLALRAMRAQPVTEAEAPQMYRIVRELSERAGQPMPRLYVSPTEAPNAFATGRNPQHAVVAVTTGIRRILTDRELRGVLGHEMGHVRNRDILTSSIVATVAGAISMIAQMLMWSSIFGGRRDNQNPLITLVVILIAPIAATLIQLGISRQREYAADKTGAEVTRDPEALASALEKLQRGVEMRPMRDTPAQEAVSALYIVKPFSMRSGGMSKLFSTHPPLEERIERLRKMRF